MMLGSGRQRPSAIAIICSTVLVWTSQLMKCHSLLNGFNTKRCHGLLWGADSPSPLSMISVIQKEEASHVHDHVHEHNVESKDNNKKNRKVVKNDNNHNYDHRYPEKEVLRLGKSGDTNRALTRYRELFATRPTVRLLNAALECCSRSRPVRMVEAVRVFEEATEFVRPNVFTLGSYVGVMARAGNHEECVNLLGKFRQEYPEVVPNAFVYSTVLRALPSAASSIREKLLKECFESSPDSRRGFVPATDRGATICCNAAASALSAEKAAHMLEVDMPRWGIAPDGVTYGTVMAAYQREAEWAKVLEVADSIPPNLEPLDGISLTICLKACQKLGLAEKAVYYFDKFAKLDDTKLSSSRRRLKSKDGGPDEAAYCLAISACSNGRRTDLGLQILKRMKEVEACSSNSPSDRIRVRTNAYTALLQGYALEGDYGSAFRLLQEMKASPHRHVQPNVVSYATVLSACAKCITKGNSDEFATTQPNHNVSKKNRKEELLRSALNLWEDVVSASADNGIQPNVIAYNSLLRVCAEAKDLPTALSLFREMKDRHGLVPTVITYGTLMTACERVADYNASVRIFAEMERAGIEPNEIVYGAAISCCRKAKRPDEALATFQSMLSRGGRKNGKKNFSSSTLEPNRAVYHTLLRALVEGHDLTNALQVVRDMPSHLVTSTTYSILVRAAIEQIRPEIAEALLNDMRRRADRGDIKPNGKPDVTHYTAVVQAYEQAGQPLKALRVLETMRSEGYDFYDFPILNAAFKKMVALAHAATAAGKVP